MITSSIRSSRLVIGDIEAKIAACRNGEREYIELLNHYGSDTLRSYAEVHDERLTCAEIARVYSSVEHIDGLSENPKPILFNAKVSVTGDGIFLDWEGPPLQASVPSTVPSPSNKSCA